VRQINPAQLAFRCTINIILLTYLLTYLLRAERRHSHASQGNTVIGWNDAASVSQYRLHKRFFIVSCLYEFVWYFHTLFSPFYILIIHFTHYIFRNCYHYLFSSLCSAAFHFPLTCLFVRLLHSLITILYLVGCLVGPMWQSLVTIGEGTLGNRRRKKRKKSTITVKCNGWRPAIAGGRP